MRFLPAAAAAALLTVPAAANEFAPAIQAYYETEISTWADDPVILAAIRAQNHRTAGYSDAQILALDEEWQAQVGAPASEIIRGVLENPAADYLRARLETAGGAITEIFVMDARGLNVAASGVTSDYWQGDEAKFRETFGKGRAALHISEVEFDESSQTFQSQLSFAILDPATQEPLGAITVGLNAEQLF